MFPPPRHFETRTAALFEVLDPSYRGCLTQDLPAVSLTPVHCQ